MAAREKFCADEETTGALPAPRYIWRKEEVTERNQAKWDYDGTSGNRTSVDFRFSRGLREIPAVMDFSVTVQPRGGGAGWAKAGLRQIQCGLADGRSGEFNGAFDADRSSSRRDLGMSPEGIATIIHGNEIAN